MRRCHYLIVLAAAGCFGPHGSGDDDVDAAPGADAPPSDCVPTRPRTVAPDVFVGPSGLEQRVIGYIDGATTSLDLQMYLFTTDSIADRLIAARGRGVALRVLLDPDHEGNPDVRARLQAAGVPTRDAPSSYPYAHAKYMVIDANRVVILSGNFNYTSMVSERNYGLVDRDPDDVADLTRVFEADWGATPATPTQPDLACSRLVVTPINAKSRVIELINGARQTLDLEIIYLSETNVRTAILDAHRRGVAVRLLLANPADYPENGDTITLMRGQGVPVKTATQIDVHAKLIVADGVAFIGSQNISTSALTLNREAGTLVFEPGAAAVAIDQFGDDWAAATTP